MIKGETVKLVVKTEVGVDPFGNPICSESIVDVDNVVVGSPYADGNVTTNDLDGARVAFTLGIPKGDTHNWVSTDVYIRGERFRTLGRPLVQTEANVPGMWNAQVKVERYE